MEIHATDQQGTASNGAQREGGSSLQALPQLPSWEQCGWPSRRGGKLQEESPGLRPATDWLHLGVIQGPVCTQIPGPWKLWGLEGSVPVGNPSLKHVTEKACNPPVVAGGFCNRRVVCRISDPLCVHIRGNQCEEQQHHRENTELEYSASVVQLIGTVAANCTGFPGPPQRGRSI